MLGDINISFQGSSRSGASAAQELDVYCTMGSEIFKNGILDVLVWWKTKPNSWKWHLPAHELLGINYLIQN